MAYVKSCQRRHLDQQLDVIKRKVRGADNRKTSADLREFAIAAAIFLAHAEFENYFVDALDGLAKAYTQGSDDVSKIPPKLRAHLICEKFGLEHITAKFVLKTGEQDIFTTIEKWFTSPNVTLLTGARPMSTIIGSDIYGDYSYPSIKNIERVLRRIGIGNPKGTLNKEGKRDVVGLLESIGSLRTALAHNATLPGVSVRDVIDRIDGLKDFGRAFDRVLYSKTRITVPHVSWVNAMR